jgi:hypothetical protein
MVCGRLRLLGADSVSALVLGFWGDGGVENWGRCGADIVLLLRFGSCEDIPPCCVDSGLDVVRLRVRGSGRGDGTGGSSLLGGAGGSVEGTVVVPPQKFPMRRYEAWGDSGARERIRGTHAASRKEVEGL